MPNISKDLSSGACRVEFDLDEQELCAIGRVTAQWAYLEHGIYAMTAGIAQIVGVDIPEDALSTSFKRRLTAFRLLVEEFAVEKELERMTRLIGKITNAEQDRHKITHAMWDWDVTDSNKIKASSFRPGYEFEKQFDAAKMHKLAEKIGEINFALQYPDGWDAALAETLGLNTDEHGNVAYARISRRLHRAMSSRKSLDLPGSDPAKPQED